MTELAPAFKAMTPLQKWETLVLSGLIGTDEPWIEDMRQALREQEATLQGSAALPSEAIARTICTYCDGHGIYDGKDVVTGEGVELACQYCNETGFAPATPTAPVQDDDAEWLRKRISSFGHDRETRARLESIATRLSPTPDTDQQGDASLRDRAGRPSDQATSVSSPEASIPNAWQHVLEDGSIDHEWITEGGVTFCAQCEAEWTPE